MKEQDPSVFLTKLLKRIDNHPGLVGLASTAQSVLQMVTEEFSDTRQITTAILQDAALTAELLRLSNASHNLSGGRSVTTIDQAIIILGLNTIEAVATKATRLDAQSSQLQDKLLHAEIITAYFCGHFCAEITRLYSPRFNTQEAMVCGLLQNLGRFMAMYHCYEDIESSHALQAENNLTESAAVEQTLGLRFEDISAAIAEHWKLPDLLQQSLSLQIGKMPPRVAANAIEWHQHCALFSRRITDTLFRLSKNRERVEVIKDIEFFRGALHLREDEVRETITRCLNETAQWLERIGSPFTLEQASDLLRKSSERVLDRLSPTDSLTSESKLVDGRTPVEIMQSVLRKLHDACGFDRTLLCLPDGSSGLVAVAGVGNNTGQVSGKFRSYGQKPDIFRLAMKNKLDLFVPDVTAPSIAQHIPEWYPKLIKAHSFQLLSLTYNNHALGLIYGDYAKAHSTSPLDSVPAEQILEWRQQLQLALHTSVSNPVSY